MIARTVTNPARPAVSRQTLAAANEDSLHIDIGFDADLLPELTDMELELMADRAERLMEDRAYWGGW
jgi:hypothetical protein